MKLDRARRVFASHMAAARTRQLTAYEKKELTAARQALRQARRPAGLSKVNPRYGGIRGYVYYQDANGKFQQDFSPPYTSSEKAKVQRWLRDAQTIIKRTGGTVHTARIDDYYGKTPGANPKQVIRAEHADVFVHNRGGLIRMGKLVEIRYYRDHGRAKGFYKHPFKVRPDIFFNPRTNTITIKGKGD